MHWIRTGKSKSGLKGVYRGKFGFRAFNADGTFTRFDTKREAAEHQLKEEPKRKKLRLERLSQRETEKLRLEEKRLEKKRQQVQQRIEKERQQLQQRLDQLKNREQPRQEKWSKKDKELLEKQRPKNKSNKWIHLPCSMFRCFCIHSDVSKF